MEMNKMKRLVLLLIVLLGTTGVREKLSRRYLQVIV